MIHDTLANARRYAPLHRHFATAFAWCQDSKHIRQNDGHYAISGDQVFAIIESGTTLPARDKRFESHRRYIDVQINLKGPEVMEWMPRSALSLFEDFKPDNDICFYEHPVDAATRLLVRPQEFAIFWPEDAHKPCCHPGEAPVNFRKIIIKVAV